MNVAGSPPSGRLKVGVAGVGGLRWVAADIAGVAEEARRRHDLSPIAASALGRCLAAAILLLRLSPRAWQRLVIEVRGDGPLRKVVAEADLAGNLRGLVGEPRVEVPAGPGGRLAIAEAVGKGILRVRREKETASYQSEVELVTGELGLDVAHYLEQSEQTRSAVLLGVLARPEGVAAAGGMILEAMPEVGEAAIARVEENLSRFEGFSRRLEREGLGGVIEAALDGLDWRVVESQELRFHCRCNRARLLSHLILLTPEERESIEHNGVIDAECAFCGERYWFTAAELAVQ